MCGFSFDPKRFRAEDHLPVPLASAIQTFLCGGSRLPFGSEAIPFRVCTLALWLVWTRRLDLLVLTLSLARCSSWCLRPQLPVIMAGLYHRTWRCPPFASLVSDMLAAPLLEVSFSCRFASLSFVFCVVALFSAVDPVAVEVSRRRSACLPPER